MANKLIYILNYDTQYPFCRLQVVVKRLDTQINEPTNENLLKVPKIIKLKNQENIIIKLWGPVQ